MSIKINNNSLKKGLILVNVLVFAVVAIVVTTSLTQWAATMLKNSRQLAAREQAFHIAEAGVDYYRWHLAHSPTDYKDGYATTSNGPFNHAFSDKDGTVIGQFALTITPPATGSTLVKIKSKGTVVSDPGVSRTIQTTLAIPSFAKYAVVANDVMRFGAGTEVFGPIHSNDGIRFDGVAHNIVTSAKATYVDPDNGSSQRFGVYTTDSPTDPNPPAAVPNRPDVFMVGRQFPVAAVDFAGITTDLSQMKADAQASGRYFAASGQQGYRIVLKSNDTFDLYRVNSLRSPPSGCTNVQSQTGWATWSIGTTGGAQTLLQSNQAFPSNGLIFVEDHLWVEGLVNTARLTIAAGRFPDGPSTRKDIIVNADLSYTNYDGQDSVALIAQGNVTTGLYSDNSLRVDGALIAQNGRIGRFYYENDCGSNAERSDITLYGMLGSNLRYGFAYTDGSGYATRNIIYDSYLLYAPPPSFPLTSDQYTTLSWEEIK